jgi:hypothetical protein
LGFGENVIFLEKHLAIACKNQYNKYDGEESEHFSKAARRILHAEL